MRPKYVYVAWLAFHFLLIVSFSCRDTFQLVAQGPTILPASFKDFSHKSETIVSIALGQDLAASNPVRQALATYLHFAGIEAGYGYFGPNIPGGYRLIFELHYPDGRVEYELPSVRSAAAGLRLASFSTRSDAPPDDVLREHLVKTVRAVFGSIRLPTVNQFEHGQRESSEFLYAYDFSIQNKPPEPKDR